MDEIKCFLARGCDAVEVKFDFWKKVFAVSESSLEWKMTDFVKIKIDVVNETKLEWKIMFGYHDV